MSFEIHRRDLFETADIEPGGPRHGPSASRVIAAMAALALLIGLVIVVTGRSTTLAAASEFSGPESEFYGAPVPRLPTPSSEN